MLIQETNLLSPTASSYSNRRSSHFIYKVTLATTFLLSSFALMFCLTCLCFSLLVLQRLSFFLVQFIYLLSNQWKPLPSRYTRFENGSKVTNDSRARKIPHSIHSRLAFFLVHRHLFPIFSRSLSKTHTRAIHQFIMTDFVYMYSINK